MITITKLSVINIENSTIRAEYAFNGRVSSIDFPLDISIDKISIYGIKNRMVSLLSNTVLPSNSLSTSDIKISNKVFDNLINSSDFVLLVTDKIHFNDYKVEMSDMLKLRKTIKDNIDIHDIITYDYYGRVAIDIIFSDSGKIINKTSEWMYSHSQSINNRILTTITDTITDYVCDKYNFESIKSHYAETVSIFPLSLIDQISWSIRKATIEEFTKRFIKWDDTQKYESSLKVKKVNE